MRPVDADAQVFILTNKCSSYNIHTLYESQLRVGPSMHMWMCTRAQRSSMHRAGSSALSSRTLTKRGAAALCCSATGDRSVGRGATLSKKQQLFAATLAEQSRTDWWDQGREELGFFFPTDGLPPARTAVGSSTRTDTKNPCISYSLEASCCLDGSRARVACRAGFL